MGPSRFTSHPKEGVLRIFIALKNTSPWPGSNSRRLVSGKNTNHYTTKTTPTVQDGEWALHTVQTQ
jgi:hypothetical protein